MNEAEDVSLLATHKNQGSELPTVSAVEKKIQAGNISLFLVLFLAIAFKSNDALTTPQFWAEDGKDFFAGQYAHWLPHVFSPYAGYLHAIPRLIAWMANLASPVRAPLIYNLSAIIMSAAGLAFVMGRLRHILPLPLMLATILVLPTSGEIFGNLTNVQWFLQLALPVACLTTAPRLRGWRAHAGDIALLLVALTGPFSLITSCLVVGLWLSSRLDHRFAVGAFGGHLATWSARSDRRAIAIVATGGLVQLITLLTHPMPLPGDAPTPLRLLKIGLFDLIPSHVFGFDFLNNGTYVLLYLIIVGALIFGPRMKGEHRLTIIALLLFAVIGALSGMAKTATIADHYELTFADRYFHALRIVFWWAAFAAIAAATPYRRKDACAIIFVCIAMVALSNPGHMRRDPMPDFQWKAHARELDKAGPHAIPFPPGWWLNVTTP